MPLLPPYPIYLSGVRNDVTNAVANGWEGPGSCPLGLLAQPLRREYIYAPEYDWLGIDNGLFTEVGQRRFDVAAYFDMISEAMSIWGDQLLFATAPDVPFDWAGTLAKSLPMLPKIRALGAPAALVTQNGATPANIPWDLCDAIFLGGGVGPDTAGKEWKITQVARDITREANRRGKFVHMGRVNSAERMKVAQDFGCGSADGTYLLHATAVATAVSAVKRLVIFTAHKWASSEADVERATATLELLRGGPISQKQGITALSSGLMSRSKNVRDLVTAMTLPMLPGEGHWEHGKRKRDALYALADRMVPAIAQAEGTSLAAAAEVVRWNGEHAAVLDITAWLHSLEKRFSTRQRLVAPGWEAAVFQHHGVMGEPRTNPVRRREFSKVQSLPMVADARRVLATFIAGRGKTAERAIKARYDFALMSDSSDYHGRTFRFAILPKDGVESYSRAYPGSPSLRPRLDENDVNYALKTPPGSIGSKIPEIEGMIYRGMSWEEWQSIRKNCEIRSRGEWNIGQPDLTFFGDADTALYYATGFAPWMFKPSKQRPGIVIAIPRRYALSYKDSSLIPESEFATRGGLSASVIERVWRIVPTEIRGGFQDITVGHGPYGKIEYGSGSGSGLGDFVVVPSSLSELAKCHGRPNPTRRRRRR